MPNKKYSELITIPTFKERYLYLKLDGIVGLETYGFDRYINQRFYTSSEWKHVRDMVIVRDSGCDLAFQGREICGKVIIHHMNPISAKEIGSISEILLDPEYLVCVSQITHNAIHYGDEVLLIGDPIERTANDTCPWKK